MSRHLLKRLERIESTRPSCPLMFDFDDGSSESRQRIAGKEINAAALGAQLVIVSWLPVVDHE